MARERSIVVRLKAEVSDFQRQIGAAGRTLSEFEKAQKEMGGAATTTMGRLVQSARINEREWSTVGRALLGVGTAMAGVGTAVLKTGIEYNTLQQTSRAALTTITGSAEQANAQMDRLDAFARTSPFAKQVFIQAQQQMLGFGIEARKVLPYLDAIQNAVAATGGSNQDIAELSRIFSQVHANAKITARELMMFGQRGVDAATIIGSQMGKTGAQIREEITAGTLDAHAALDALAAGMQDSFGGAAANVKETVAGAFDRVKAAFRDFASEMATPLVDPMGGGALIDWLNKLADGMRAFEGRFKAMPDWAKTAGLALGGITTAVTLMGGAAILAVPKYLALRDALSTLATVHPNLGKISGAIGTTAKVAAGAIGTLAALNVAVQLSGVAKGTSNLEALQLQIRRGVGDLQLYGIHWYDLDVAFERLQRRDLGDWFGDNITGPLLGVHGDVQRLTQEFNILGTELASLFASDPDLAMKRFGEILDITGASSEEMLALMPALALALDDAGSSAGGAAGATDELAESQARAQERMEAWQSAGESMRATFQDVMGAFDEAMGKQEEFGLSAAKTVDEWIAAMRRQREAAENLRDNVNLAYRQIADEVPPHAQAMAEAFIFEMRNAGDEGALAIEYFVGASAAQRAEMLAEWAGTGALIEEYSTPRPIPLDVDTSRAISEANKMMGDWETTTTETKVAADTRTARDDLRRFIGEVRDTETPTVVAADMTPAMRTFDSQTRAWKDVTTETLLGMNPATAIQVFNRETGKWENTLVKTQLGLNTSQATNTLNAWKSKNNSFTVWANVQTRGGVNPGAMLGKYHGGKIATTPGLNAGGKVPGPRAPYDNVLWPLHAGGQTLRQPLSGGEWVINPTMSARYDRELASMNAGTYPVGGGISSADMLTFARIVAAETASAVREGSREGASVGTRAGFSDLASGARLSGAVV